MKQKRKPHGMAVRCLREASHTIAWIDPHLSREVPAGWFTETWLDRNITRVGRIDGRYQYGDEWLDWYDAVLWCRSQGRGTPTPTP